jgi:hypothetical protein
VFVPTRETVEGSLATEVQFVGSEAFDRELQIEQEQEWEQVLVVPSLPVVVQEQESSL